MEQPPWRVAAVHQAGLLAISQLPDLGVTRATLRNQLRAERWAMRTDRVLSTTTGELNELQRMWLGVLHVGNGALVGGLTAARRHGLRGWDRDKVTILVPDDWSFEPVPVCISSAPGVPWRCSGPRRILSRCAGSSPRR